MNYSFYTSLQPMLFNYLGLFLYYFIDKCGDGLAQLKEPNLSVKKTKVSSFSININNEWCSNHEWCLF